MKRLSWVAAAVIPMLVAACSGGPGGGTGGGGQGGSGGDGGQGGGDPAVGSWSQDFTLPGAAGQGARVKASVFGPDGRMYVGGLFEDIAGTPARNVAAWDGTSWKALGEGLPGDVRALGVGSDGAVYAGGDLPDEAGRNTLARWNGTAWERVPGEIDGTVLEITPSFDRLLVGGDFQHADGMAASGIAAFDGIWSSFGDGIPGGAVHAIDVRDETAFCVGGAFTTAGTVAAKNAACWDGTEWSQLADGLPGAVHALAGDYAGGSFAFTNPQDGSYLAGLAKIDNGKWTPLAGGVDDGFINDVRALAFDWDFGLYVGGHFHTVGKGGQNLGVSHLAYLKDGVWSDPGGLHNMAGVFLPSEVGVHTLSLDSDGAVFVGGVFTSAGSAAAANVARLSGRAFEALAPGFEGLGISGTVDALALGPGGHVFAAGAFTAAGDDASIRNVARLGDEGWEPVGSPLEGTVRALAVLEDSSLLAGGDFLGVNGQWLPHLAVLDDIGWLPFGPELDNQVFAIEVDADGHIYVGGDFEHAGNEPLAHLARWNGETFEPVGGGVDGRVTSIAFDAEGRLVVGGMFQNAGDVRVNGVAVWDGESWSALGGGLGGPIEGGKGGGYINVVAASGEDIYAGGSFAQIGGLPISSLARWDGSKWSAVGEPLTSPEGDAAVVTGMLPYGKGLFVTGTFTFAGEEEARYLAWFDGERFTALGGGLSDLGEALLVRDRELIVGGPFLSAGDRVSSGLAIWKF